MAEKKSSLEEEIRNLEKKTKEAAQKPLPEEIEELRHIKDRLEVLKDQLDPPEKR